MTLADDEVNFEFDILLQVLSMCVPRHAVIQNIK